MQRSRTINIVLNLCAGVAIARGAVAAPNRVFDHATIYPSGTPGLFHVQAAWHVEDNSGGPLQNVSTIVELLRNGGLVEAVVNHGILQPHTLCPGGCDGSECGIIFVNGAIEDMYCLDSRDGSGCKCQTRSIITDFGEMPLNPNDMIELRLSEAAQSVPDANPLDNSTVYQFPNGPIWWNRAIEGLELSGVPGQRTLRIKAGLGISGVEEGFDVGFRLAIYVNGTKRHVIENPLISAAMLSCGKVTGVRDCTSCPQVEGYLGACMVVTTSWAWPTWCYCKYGPEIDVPEDDYGPLSDGDEIRVALEPPAGALPEFNTTDDSAVLVVKACSADLDGDDDTDVFDFGRFAQDFGCPN